MEHIHTYRLTSSAHSWLNTFSITSLSGCRPVRSSTSLSVCRYIRLLHVCPSVQPVTEMVMTALLLLRASRAGQTAKQCETVSHFAAFLSSEILYIAFVGKLTAEMEALVCVVVVYLYHIPYFVLLHLLLLTYYFLSETFHWHCLKKYTNIRRPLLFPLLFIACKTSCLDFVFPLLKSKFSSNLRLLFFWTPTVSQPAS